MKPRFYSLVHKAEQRIFDPKENARYAFDYRLSDKLLRFLTLGWLGWLLLKYQELKIRPDILFEPKVWLQQLMMKTLPGPLLFYFIVGLAVFLTVWTLKKHHSGLRFFLWLLLVYLNLVPWSYNALPHVGHLFLLTHFLGIFLFPDPKGDENEIARGVHWFHFGLLMTYSLAGFWKLIGLFYRAFLTPDKPSWLTEGMVKATGVVNYRIYGLEIPDWLYRVFGLPFVWELMMILVIAIQLFAFLGAVNKRLSYVFALGLIAFHIFNIFFFQTFFFAAPLVLFVVFFPYSLLFKAFDRYPVVSADGSR